MTSRGGLYFRRPHTFELKNFRWGAWDIAINLLSIVLVIIGLVGIQKKSPLLFRFLTASVVGNIGWWISTVIMLHIKAAGFTVPDAAAVIVTITIVLLLAFFGLYFFYCLESLCFTLQKERHEEEPAEVVFHL